MAGRPKLGDPRLKPHLDEHDDVIIRVAEKLKAHLQRHGMTQVKLAMIGWPDGAHGNANISRIIQLRATSLELETIARVAVAMGVSLQELMFAPILPHLCEDSTGGSTL